MDTKGNPQQEVIETENNAFVQATAMNSMFQNTNFVSEFNKHEMEKYWADKHCEVIFRLMAMEQYTPINDEKLVELIKNARIIMLELKGKLNGDC